MFRMLTFLSREFSTSYKILDIRNHDLYVVEDRQAKLQYMRQVIVGDGQKGIVIKIQQQARTYLAMYNKIKNFEEDLVVKQSGIPWQKSVQQFMKNFNHNQNGVVLDTNLASFYTSSQLNSTTQIQKTNKISSLSPIFDICYDFHRGDMLNFIGCLGSRRTSTLSNIFYSNNHSNQTNIYFNPSSFNQSKVFADSGAIAFNNGPIQKRNQTDAGVYMLALKSIELARRLSQKGRDVFIALDNFQSLLHAEWSMLQLLKGPVEAKQKMGQTVDYNALKIPPVSILNELYSNCSNKNKKGSLTVFVCTQAAKDELTPQITPYSNNLKHLASLSSAINFPLSIRHNPNAFTSTEDNYRQIIRKQINYYLTEKKDSQLKRQLYKSDIRDAPWDYYHMLDADWWLSALKSFSPKSISELNEFIIWIGLNIEEELISNWKINAIQSLNLYHSFLATRSLASDRKNFLQFVNWARLQGYFSVFKKDYLN